MTRKGRRLTLIATALAIIGIAVGLGAYAMRGNIALFLTPSELAAKYVAVGSRLRIGGLVATGSVEKSGDDKLAFRITDGGKQEVRVTYQGVTPDLFREGQGVVAEGILEAPGEFRAETILAKHDERYMPREVVDSLKKQGRWQEGQVGQAASPGTGKP